LSDTVGLLGVYVATLPDHDIDPPDPVVHDERSRSDVMMRMENFMDYDYFIEYFLYEISIENCIDFAILFAFVRHF
jgi:hypothetical protein